MIMHVSKEKHEPRAVGYHILLYNNRVCAIYMLMCRICFL